MTSGPRLQHEGHGGDTPRPPRGRDGQVDQRPLPSVPLALPRVAPEVGLLRPLAESVASCTVDLLGLSGARLRTAVDDWFATIGRLVGATRMVAWRVDRQRRQIVLESEWAAPGHRALVDFRPYSEWSDLPWGLDAFDRPRPALDRGHLAAWLGVDAVLVVPASLDGRLSQIVAVAWSGAGTSFVDDETARALEPVIRQLALAMCAARDRRELAERASYDELTGLANRPFLVLALGKMVARVSRGKTSGVAVLFCQLAGLDPNDRAAFERADDAVARAAVMLERSTRETDFVGRWDDTTFAALCDEVPAAAEAVRIGRRLHHSVLTEIRVAFSDDPTWARGNIANVRVAVGVAFTDVHEHGGVLLRRADLALSRARVELDDPVKLVLE